MVHRNKKQKQQVNKKNKQNGTPAQIHINNTWDYSNNVRYEGPCIFWSFDFPFRELVLRNKKLVVIWFSLRPKIEIQGIFFFKIKSGWVKFKKNDSIFIFYFI